MALGLMWHGSRRNEQGPSPAWAVETAVQALREQFGYRVYQPSPTELMLEFCPVGFVSLRVDGELILGEAATTPAGPGFHKAVVDFLDALAGESGIDLEVVDETGYWRGRESERLWAAHLGWLQVAIRLALSQAGAAPRVAWPLDGWVPVGQTGVITPVGRFAHAWLEHELAADGLAGFARSFFIWPNSERDACYWRGVALYLLWNQCCWVSPRCEREAALAAEVLDALDRARRIDPTITLPLAAWAELSSLAGRPPGAVPEGPAMAPDGPIGYRRGDLIETLPGGWRARLPGLFLKEREPDGGYVYWDTDRNFRLTPYRYGSRVDEKSPLDDQLVPNPALNEVMGGHRYMAAVTPEEDEGCWVLQGLIRGPGGMAVVTITWAGERWADWGLRSFRSIQPPPLAPD